MPLSLEETSGTEGEWTGDIVDFGKAQNGSVIDKRVVWEDRQCLLGKKGR